MPHLSNQTENHNSFSMYVDLFFLQIPLPVCAVTDWLLPILCISTAWRLEEKVHGFFQSSFFCSNLRVVLEFLNILAGK